MRAKLWVVCGLAAVVGCGPVESPRTSGHEPQGEKLPFDPNRQPTLVEAVSRVYGEDCGNGMLDISYKRSEAVIKAATQEELTSAYIEVISAGGVNSWTIAGVASAATSAPFSAKFRDALRAVRNGLTEGWIPVFDYFAAHGDGTDLKWMEARMADGKPLARRDEAEAAVTKLKKRLADQGQ